MRLETKILANLIYNENYTRKVIPFIKPEYFQERLEKVVVEEITTFFNEYNQLPTQDILNIELGNRTDITDKELAEVHKIVNALHEDRSDFQWLIDNTEKFCKDKAVYNAILQGIKIIDRKDDKLSQEAIPKILSDALAVSFDTKTGHDYLKDIQERYDFYHRVEEKIPFDLEMMNKITDGGLSNKTLSVVLAGVNAGKSLFMCHVAASSLIQGKNVLYITMEMSENKIAQRIDANLLNIPINQIKSLDYDSFNTRVSKIAKKTQGKLIIKEYPTASAHSGHFRALLEELKTKQDFSPDILIIDYLNICCSARMKMGSSINSYTYVKSIAEEIRGLAVEYDIPILSATQATRCLALDTIVILECGDRIQIKDIKIGDRIQTHNGYTEVKYVYPIEQQQVYEITTKSGKKIICSNKHIFPTIEGEKNILSGLSEGDFLFSKK